MNRSPLAAAAGALAELVVRCDEATGALLLDLVRTGMRLADRE